jgi:hypothetical protein
MKPLFLEFSAFASTGSFGLFFVRANLLAISQAVFVYLLSTFSFMSFFF